MSKIGKKNIVLPKDTSIKIDGDKISVNGPKGNKDLFINHKIFSSKVNDKNEFHIGPINKDVDHKTRLGDVACPYFIDNICIPNRIQI